MSCFSRLFPRRKEITSNRIGDSFRVESNDGFTANSSIEERKKAHVHGPENICAQSYHYRELATATRNFKEALLIGEGGFGKVYKGQLDSGAAVAVKKLNREGAQGSHEFLVEVLMLSMLRHPNLVTLYGYCAEGDEKLMVYEYLPQGSLEDQLFDLPPTKQPLDWNTRIKIASGAANGLAYLHDVANPPVIYRDMKAANILLDNNFNPKLSDFGLAKLAPVGDRTHVSTRVMGTYGYCAPDYAMSGKLTVKSDIYSFGVLLLELISGRRAYDSTRIRAEQNLITWARPFLSDRRKFFQLADPLLQGRFPYRAFFQMIAITYMCIQDHPHARPVVADVVTALNHVHSQPYILEPDTKSNSSPSPSASPSLHASTTTPSKGRKGVSGAISSSSSRSRNFGQSADHEIIYPEGEILEVPNLRVFSFGELKSATRNFKADTVLGEGGFGRVYKGWVDEKSLNPIKSGLGMVIAVKKLNPDSMQGLEEWKSEVNFLGRLSHPNLVRLLGYCWEDKELLLVYEFMARGSLENHLFRRGVHPLSWSLRLKVLLGAARGLAFLHSSERQVIYRDFKASNILLDSNYNSKLSDFGLAKNGPTGEDSHVSTRVIGTYGYAAPEYVATGRLYVKSDVYGFGVVLLEMLSGQRALDPSRPSWQHNLVEWAKPYLSDRKKLTSLMDPRLEGRYSSKGAHQVAQLTLRCLCAHPKKRPSMKEVVEILESVEAMKNISKEPRDGSRLRSER